MAASSTLSSKGQVTIPLEIRNRLGLKGGDRVEFVVDQGRTILRPAHPADNPFERYIGSLPIFENAEEINKWVADMRDEDDAV